MVEEINNTVENGAKAEEKSVVDVEQSTGPKVFTVESILFRKKKNIFYMHKLNCLSEPDITFLHLFYSQSRQ